MNSINQHYIVEYIRKKIKDEEEFKDIRKYAEKNHIPIIQPEVKQLLKVIIQIKGAESILEVGTAIGYSSMIMASVISEKAKVYTIERNKNMIKLAKENLIKKGYQDKVEILEGDATEILKNFDKKVDLIFIDGAKAQYKNFLEHILKNLNPNGIIIADNVLFKGMVASDELMERRKKTIIKRMRSYIEYISEREDFETSIIPIGDGVSISYIRR